MLIIFLYTDKEKLKHNPIHNSASENQLSWNNVTKEVKDQNKENYKTLLLAIQIDRRKWK